MAATNPAYGQAKIPGFNPLQRPWTIAPPLLIGATGAPAGPTQGAANTKNIAFDRAAEPNVRAVYIQNLTAAGAPIKYLLNDPNPNSGTPAAELFHGVLTGGTSTDDGVGSQAYFDFQKIDIKNIVLFAPTTFRAVVIKYYA